MELAAFRHPALRVLRSPRTTPAGQEQQALQTPQMRRQKRLLQMKIKTAAALLIARGQTLLDRWILLDPPMSPRSEVRRENCGSTGVEEEWRPRIWPSLNTFLNFSRCRIRSKRR